MTILAHPFRMLAAHGGEKEAWQVALGFVALGGGV